MPKNMSFAMTIPQIKARTKTVTRRFGWWQLKEGDVICAVEKAMGLKKGEKVVRLGMLGVKSVRREKLNAITREDCIAEGFPDMTPEQFISMLCKQYNCKPDRICNRIEFGYLGNQLPIEFQ
ncbi:hypothetical protein R50073_24290 [Maricurvus nonylphenolicus]|uniref:hypothetical protein n=1 Tax=Maricurvus nonylphenolicus TaxID=1008307 RepID=UPI0036F25BCB